MKIVLIDTFAGVSGDMMLGALIDAGVPAEHIQSELQKTGLREFGLKTATIKKHSISATKVTVEFNPERQPHRNFNSIKELIDNSDLSPYVKKKSIEAFTLLGNAEAKIHNTTLDKIHFHEVGAVDSICDLIGSIIGFEFLGVSRIYGTPVPLGTGFTKTHHGMMPVPSPAALEILNDYPVIHKESGYEMTTPTGATLLKILVHEVINENTMMNPKKTGYGAGTYDSDKWPNLLRLIIAQKPEEEQSNKFVIETNIDDMNPEIFPYLMNRLYNAGANDVFLTQIIMKKGRPGIKITVICDRSKHKAMETLLFSETTTIGTRYYSVSRSELQRKAAYLDTKFGKVKVKIILKNGRSIVIPEYESCREIAENEKIPILDVYKEIEKRNPE